jgi:hypothetical protein
LAEKWTTVWCANDRLYDIDEWTGAMIAEISDTLSGMTGRGHMLNQSLV